MIPNPSYATASRTPTDLRMTESFPIIRGGRLSSTRARFSCRSLSTPAAVFEELFVSHGWGNSWRNGIYDFAHYHSGIHEVLGIARGGGRVRLGGANGRALTLRAGDVAILPAGTGHQREKASEDFLVVGAYPTMGVYDECRSPEDREKALRAIARAARPRKDLSMARTVL
jgi:uncharacterized protein YjlB